MGLLFGVCAELQMKQGESSVEHEKVCPRCIVLRGFDIFEIICRRIDSHLDPAVNKIRLLFGGVKRVDRFHLQTSPKEFRHPHRNEGRSSFRNFGDRTSGQNN